MSTSTSAAQTNPTIPNIVIAAPKKPRKATGKKAPSPRRATGKGKPPQGPLTIDELWEARRVLAAYDKEVKANARKSGFNRSYEARDKLADLVLRLTGNRVPVDICEHDIVDPFASGSIYVDGRVCTMSLDTNAGSDAWFLQVTTPRGGQSD